MFVSCLCSHFVFLFVVFCAFLAVYFIYSVTDVFSVAVTGLFGLFSSTLFFQAEDVRRDTRVVLSVALDR